jgi:hypothetical protein
MMRWLKSGRKGEVHLLPRLKADKHNGRYIHSFEQAKTRVESHVLSPNYLVGESKANLVQSL